MPCASEAGPWELHTAWASAGEIPDTRPAWSPDQNLPKAASGSLNPNNSSAEAQRVAKFKIPKEWSCLQGAGLRPAVLYLSQHRINIFIPQIH